MCALENTKIMGEFPTGQAYSCKISVVFGFNAYILYILYKILFVFYKMVPYFREFFVIVLQNGNEKIGF